MAINHNSNSEYIVDSHTPSQLARGSQVELLRNCCRCFFIENTYKIRLVGFQRLQQKNAYQNSELRHELPLQPSTVQMSSWEALTVETFKKSTTYVRNQQDSFWEYRQFQIPCVGCTLTICLTQLSEEITLFPEVPATHDTTPTIIIPYS